MKLSLSALFALLLTFRTAGAQAGDQPNLVLTIFGGAATGNGLWEVARQPLCVLNTADDNCSAAFDTLRLQRDVTSSLIAGAGATYYSSPQFGYTAEVFYLGLPLDDGCNGILFNPDPGADPTYGPRNQQLCNSIGSASLSTSAIAFFVGFVFRAASRAAISPYVRGSFGVVSYSSGTIEVSGDFVQSNRVRSRAVIIDDHPKQSAFSGQVAGGITVRLGPGYRFRFELRDVVVPLKRVIGPAELANGLQAPTATKVTHHAALALGLDIVLERKRGRRY